MSDSEIRLGSNNVHEISSFLALELGIPTDVIEQALSRALEQYKTRVIDNSSPASINVHNNIQESKTVDDLSQNTVLISLNSNHDSHIDTDPKIYRTQEDSPIQSSRNSRKDSLSSLIEITQSEEKSINIKLPSLHVPIQKETPDNQNSPGVNTNPFEENFNQPLYSDEKNISNRSNNDNFVPDIFENIPSRRIVNNEDTYESSVPKVQNQRTSGEYNQQSLVGNHVQDAYVRNRQINDSTSDVFENYTQSRSLELQDSQDQDSYINQQSQNTKSSEAYSSEWPSLSEAAGKGNSRKNSGVDLGGWGPIDTNTSSAWSTPRNWSSSETETNNIFEPLVTKATWNPDDADLTWKPIQGSKVPKNKKKPVNFELDDNDGWGPQPKNYVPWDDEKRQGYCVDLIEEQKETVFWSMQNGAWVNVSEESRITSEKKTDEFGASHRNIRQIRTQRIERQGIQSLDTSWDSIREQTRRERQELGLVNNETAEELTDRENDNSDSSEIRSSSNHAKYIPTGPMEGPRERPGSPKWKTEEEWRNERKQTVEYGDLINLEHDTSGSKEVEEPLEVTSDRNKDVEAWNNWSDDEKSTEVTDFEKVKDDPWYAEDVTNDEQEQQEDIIEEPEENLLINLDSNSDNLPTESTIINTHPPIFYGRVNNDMEYLDLFCSINPDNRSTNVNVVNNESNLLSFDDEEGNKTSNNIISVETSRENERDNSFDLDKFEAFLENKSETKSHEMVELHEKEQNFPYTINLNDNDGNDGSNVSLHYTGSFAPSRSYRCEVSSQAFPNVNGKDNKDSVSKPQNATYPTDQTDPNSNFTSKANGKKCTINLTVETLSDGKQTLHIHNGDDPLIATKEFCKKWDMPNFEEALNTLVQQELDKRRRRKKQNVKNKA